MDKKAVMKTARRVVKREAEALDLLADSIDDGFTQAASMMLGATGRVIVSGIGKSGLIARKIAATLASTGTPAYFVHPSEASHGDLGMVTTGDVALLISYSGEAPELADLVAYTRRFGIPLIGLSGKRDSTLIRRSDVAIILPPADEACDKGIVPTSSTTMTLAIGDALAIALMEHRHFGPENFRDFHPGGKLGARLTRVSDIMHRDMPLVGGDTAMGEALIVISQKGFGVVGVNDDNGHLTGIVTDGDLRRHMSGLLDQIARDVMTPNPVAIPANALAEEAVALMNDRKVTCLFAVDPENNKRPVGILHVHDCLRAGVV